MDHLKLLPRIEVSFQDDFCGCEREITKTPQYILNQLSLMNINPKIGDDVLLFEKDVDKDNHEYYLCNLGKISSIDSIAINDYSQREIKKEEMVYLGKDAVIVKIDKNAYFDLPLNSAVFN